MPGRSVSNGSGYRYGFNGQESSTEVNNNSFTAEFWQYDARLGRRWNLDPKPSIGISQYSTFSNNPILFSDPLGDTTVVGAGGTHTVNIDERANALEYYGSSNYTLAGTQTQAPVQAGQLRSFSNALGTFSARWTTDANGAPVFSGYKNGKNQTLEAAVQELQDFASSWKYKLWSWGGYLNQERDKNPLAFDLKLAVTLMSVSATVATEPAPFSPARNSSVITQESMSSLGTLNFATSRGENLAFGLNHTLDNFSLATGFKNYRQFTSGGFKPDEILNAIKNPNNSLHFNLEGFTRWKYLKYCNNPVPPSPALRNVSNWELHTIYNTPGALERANFYNLINGSYQNVPKPF